MEKFIQAGKFKAECLHIMDLVNSSGQEVIVTKHKVPIVRLCPMQNKKRSLYGSMEGTVHIKGDIIQPVDEKWNAEY